MQPKTLLMFTAAALAAVAGMWMAGEVQKQDSGSALKQQPIQGLILSTPRKLGIPDLEQGDGSVFSKADMQGQWSLMFYGYTNCPDICPTTLNTVAAARKQSQDFPQVVFVSVDPNRDDASMVGEYVKYFDKEFVGVTGEPKLLDAMATQMSVVARSQAPDKEGGQYLVDHSSNLLLIDPEVRLVAMLKPPHSVDSINQAIRTVVAP